jgi:hypothetical protein
MDHKGGGYSNFVPPQYKFREISQSGLGSLGAQQGYFY